METARRRKAGGLAIRKLENDVSQFIELDKASFLSSAKLFSTYDAFKLLKRLSGRPSLPSKVYWKDTEAETVLDKANLFNSFFKSVSSELSNGSVDFVQETTSDIFLSEICFDSLQLCEFLRDIPTGTIAACDGIPPFIYSSCSELLAPYVHSLFRFILRTTCWPLFWKCAHVTPIHKKGLKTDIENYRPISILSRLSLVFERILFNYLYSKIRHKINSNQHGFQQSHSTITQLVLFIDELYANFDNNWEQIVLYLYFSKAFDTVNHATLISKLAYFGLDLEFRNLIRSYLADRTQRVCIDGNLSDIVSIGSGVPQGSVLGPLLFLVYIDDILSLPKNSNCYCFADDTKLVCSSTNVFGDSQEDINRLYNWSNSNSLKFNASKCSYIHISKKTTGDLFLNNEKLRKVESTTDLGIEVTSCLRCDFHIRSKLNKAKQNFNYLRHNVPYSLPNKVKFNLYSACVLSVLLYGSPAWHAGLTHLQLLEKFNEKCLRWCFDKRSYSDLLLAADTIPIAYQLLNIDLKLFATIATGKSCITFENFFILKKKNRSLRSENKQYLDSKYSRKSVTETSFFNRVTLLVNDFNDFSDINILFPPANIKSLLKGFFVSLRDLKYDISRTCTWSIKCRCAVCRC